MKNFFRTLLPCLLTATFCLSTFAQKTCYERNYTEEHLKKNPKQTLKSLKVTLEKSGKQTYIFVNAIPVTHPNRVYRLGVDYSLNKKIICEGINGDGDGDGSAGCISYLVNKSSIVISPITKIFNVKDNYNSTPGMLLTYCSVNWNDGGECNGVQDSISLLPENKQDLNYRVDRVTCPAE